MQADVHQYSENSEFLRCPFSVVSIQFNIFHIQSINLLLFY